MKDHDCEKEWCYECCTCPRCGEQAYDLLVSVMHWYLVTGLDDRCEPCIPKELSDKIDRFLEQEKK